MSILFRAFRPVEYRPYNVVHIQRTDEGHRNVDQSERNEDQNEIDELPYQGYQGRMIGQNGHIVEYRHDGHSPNVDGNMSIMSVFNNMGGARGRSTTFRDESDFGHNQSRDEADHDQSRGEDDHDQSRRKIWRTKFSGT